MKKIDETRIPPKEAFYSELTDKGITDEDYQHFQTENHNLYNLSDVLLLADIFENFRNTCMNHYGLQMVDISVRQVLPEMLR